MINISTLTVFILLLIIICMAIVAINIKTNKKFMVACAIAISVLSFTFLIICCDALLSSEGESKFGKYTSIVDEKYVTTTNMDPINNWYLINNGTELFYSENNGYKNKMVIRCINEEDAKIVLVNIGDIDSFHVELYHAKKKFLIIYADVTYYKIFISPEFISSDTDFIEDICDRV